MANQYLVDVHRFINSNMETAQKSREAAAAGGDRTQIDYFDGQLEELARLRAFLRDHFDLTTQRYY